MVRFFVSFSVKDREFVENEVLRLIKAVGGVPWYAPEDIAPATDWSMDIDKGLNLCDWFVLVMSQSSARSKWVLDEVNWAVSKRPDRIIPIRIDQSDPERFNIRLLRIERVEYAPDNRQAETKLISSLSIAMRAPARSAESLSGDWSGRFFQDLGPSGEPINYAVQLSLVGEKGRLSGTMTILDYPHPTEGRTSMGFSVDGMISYERFLQINYSSANSAVVQFGALLSELSDLGNTMNGRFIGYGAVSRRIVSGRIEFQKD